ncbi:DUF2490 domain-containing protein [Spirosoma endbachense]|uniref:DUF2490 domain-containing protein n=1 Tax=Spirosoma endbachense TaxID=2666025 RepID=A0A6P1VWN6_9BACT|nr:DUF2490 domain-containing protein [Spirosoma endbachense]QHV96788.1 DUF2490 domain-containing protein [Spirosoma endbachense]
MNRIRFASLLTVSLLSIISQCSFAQTSLTPATPWGSWLIGTLQLPGGEKKWGGFAEVQARSNGVMRQFFYYELKGGVSYDIDRNFTLTVAGGHYATYDYQALADGPLNSEKRLWEQLIINQYLSRVKFEHRYRIEQRWFTYRDGSHPFRNRIRYRLNTFIPLNNRTITDKTAFLSVYDEVFLNPVGPTFERNRFYAGAGYQLDKNWIIQIGWVNQTNYSPATFERGVFTPQAASGKNNIVLGLTYRISRRSGNQEKLPSQPD